MSWRVKTDFKGDQKSTFQWENVKVLTQRPDKNLQRIQFEDGFTKKINRLGIIFNGENAAHYIQRVDAARFNK